ncbi:MAG TPA: ABC transporter permease [Anaerolineales bacterium]|nr:ABC transporter permease [Anaerolineales bacterium]
MAAQTTTPRTQDDRLVEAGFLKRMLSRPELGALGGAVLVWVFFALVAGDRGFLTIRGAASYLEVSSHLGILAVAVALLMIGGEFDLSIGSMIGWAGMVMAILASQWGVPLYIGAILSLVIAMGVGALNGYMVLRTKLPSFIITLASLFVLRGLTIGLTRTLTGVTNIGGMADLPGYELMRVIFASDIPIGEANFPISIIWWFAVAAIGTWVLIRTKVGNWIFGTGGDQNAARNVGVPVAKLKIGLFMTTAFAAWLVAVIQVIGSKSANVLRGEQQEFTAIIATVIGGTLLTGGYGSAVGALLGALIFGMTKQGIVFWGIDSDWFQVFLGVTLIIAVLVNNYIRKRAEEARQ